MSSSSWNPINAAALLVLLAVPLASTAQEQPQNKTPAKYSTGVNLVLVPVVVTDKQGHHVSGLTADDFELKQDGDVQKIASLDEVTAETTRAQRPVFPPNMFTNQVVVERPKKLVIIALDLVNNHFVGQAEATRGLIEFLANGSATDTLVTLLAFQPNGVRFIHDFTGDPAVLIGALRKLRASPSTRDTPTAEPRVVVVGGADISGEDLNAEAARLASILGGGVSNTEGDAGTQIEATRAQLGAAGARVDASRESQNGLITLECFQQVAQYFAAVPGRKSLIWASVGFGFSTGSMAGEATKGTTIEEWQRTARMLQDANIAVYPVDVGGLLPTSARLTATDISNIMVIKTNTPEGGVGARSAALQANEAGRFLDPTEEKHTTMRTVADMTGGQAYYNLNDSDELFRRAALESSQYYMLTYTIKDSGKYGWRKLSVKVHRDGTQVRYRNGFYYRNPTRESEASRQAELRSALDSNVNFTSLPIRGTWQQVEQAGDKRKVHFLLQLPPGAAAIDSEQENHVSIDFAVNAVDSSGKEVARISQRLDRKLPPAGADQLQSQGLGYSNALTLAPGRYNVHVVVRDNLRGVIGSVVTPLQVN